MHVGLEHWLGHTFLQAGISYEDCVPTRATEVLCKNAMEFIIFCTNNKYHFNQSEMKLWTDSDIPTKLELLFFLEM